MLDISGCSDAIVSSRDALGDSLPECLTIRVIGAPHDQPPSLNKQAVPDRRPEWEKARERDFIAAANSLKTLSVTDRGGMSIDPEELREHIIASREQLKHLVREPGASNSSVKRATDTQVDWEVNPHIEAPVEAVDYIELLAWRRLPSGGAVRYLCVQSTVTCSYAVATASLFSGGTESLPPWVGGITNRQLATTLQRSELRWFDS